MSTCSFNQTTTGAANVYLSYCRSKAVPKHLHAYLSSFCSNWKAQPTNPLYIILKIQYIFVIQLNVILYPYIGCVPNPICFLFTLSIWCSFHYKVQSFAPVWKWMFHEYFPSLTDFLWCENLKAVNHFDEWEHWGRSTVAWTLFTAHCLSFNCLLHVWQNGLFVFSLQSFINAYTIGLFFMLINEWNQIISTMPYYHE